MERAKKMGSFKKWKTLALFILALGFSLISWSQAAVPEAEAETFTKHILDSDFDNTQFVYVADVDGDGDIDVLGASPYNGPAYDQWSPAASAGDNITWWENIGNKNFTKHVIDSDFKYANSVRVVDINGDGYMDILAAAGYRGTGDDIAWWKNDGNENFTQKYIIADDFNGAGHIYAADFNGDGYTDIFGMSSPSYSGTADEIAWWKNDGSENFTKHVITADMDGVRSIYVADIDGDGDTDILGAASVHDITANEVAWWESDGNGNFAKHVIYDNFKHIGSLYAADIDGDGDTDILGVVGYVYPDSGKEIAWWENDGSENFTKYVIATYDSDYVKSVCAADVDGDGNIDILGATRMDVGEIAWWKNDGSENFTKYVADEYGAGVSFVCAADVDGDGNTDILGTAAWDDRIFWLENDSDNDPPSLTTEAHIPDEPTGTFIDNGDIVNLADIDEAGEKITIYSNASDASGIFNQKIKWWRYDSEGTFISGGSSEWWLGDGSESIEIPGPLNDGDRIEYQSEATDTVLNPTAYHPAGSETCGITPCAQRYSFTVKSISVTLSAVPSSGTPPLNNVDLIADIDDSSSATGDIKYEFDCSNDGWDEIITTGDDPYIKPTPCSYAVSDTANVRVTREGITATATADITVNDPPTASITCDPVSCEAYICNSTGMDSCGLELRNTSTDTEDCPVAPCAIPPDNGFKSCFLDINSGAITFSDCSDPPVTFNLLAGTYTNAADLTVTDQGDLSDSDQKTIIFKKDAYADFECSLDAGGTWEKCNALATNPEEGDTVDFRAVDGTNLSTFSDGAVSLDDYSWDFEDIDDGIFDINGDQPTPSYVYTAAGNYKVTLRVTDSAGRRAKKFYTIIVSSAVAAHPVNWMEISSE